MAKTRTAPCWCASFSARSRMLMAMESSCIVSVGLEVCSQLADARQLLTGQHADNALAADDRTQRHQTRVMAHHVTNYRRVSPNRVFAHGEQEPVSILRRHSSDELAFVGHVERIEPEH